LTGGDLDLLEDVSIIGAGAGQTTIDGGNLDDRVIENITTMTLEGTVIEGVKITGGNLPTGVGGAIRNWGTITIKDCVIDGNGAAGGGGIFNNNTAELVISNSDLSNNAAFGTGTDPVEGLGGGIFNSGGHVTIHDSVVWENDAAFLGGGIYSEYASSLSISGTTVYLNEAGVAGGGIYVGDVIHELYSNLLVNSTVSGNAAGTGGGIYVGPNRNVVLTNTTIANNSASTEGGGIYTEAELTLGNTIIAENSAPTGTDAKSSATVGTVTSAGHNLIGNGDGFEFTPATGDLVGIDPELGPLQNNGGPTPTHALEATSPAIDAGDNTLAVDADGVALAYDQRGDEFDRFIDATGQGEAIVDIGAVESGVINVGPIDAVIDITPGSDKNEINLNSNGRVRVAILSTQVAQGDPFDFEATSLTGLTLDAFTFGDADGGIFVNAVNAALEDVDGDGDLDYVLQFSIRELRESGAMNANTVDALFTADLDGDTHADVEGEEAVIIKTNGNGNGSGAGTGKARKNK
jgi:predicted outer membrane repeat protein